MTTDLQKRAKEATLERLENNKLSVMSHALEAQEKIADMIVEIENAKNDDDLMKIRDRIMRFK